MHRRHGRVAGAGGLTLAMSYFLWCLLESDSWRLQAYTYEYLGPVLSAAPAWLAWQGAHQTGLRGARRFCQLLTAAWVIKTLAALYGAVRTLTTGELDFPTPSVVPRYGDLAVLILVLAALLSVPLRTRWSTSFLRLSLDMATMLTAGAMYLWYFAVAPGLQAVHSAGSSVTLLVQSAGVFVALFALARLVLGGVAEVSHAALGLWACAGLVDVLLGVLQETAFTTQELHYVLAAWALFMSFLIAAGYAQLHSSASPIAASHSPKARPYSAMPYLAVGAGYILLVIAMVQGLNVPSWTVLAGTALITALVAARQWVAVRDNTRLLVRLDQSVHALHESMTREQVVSDLGTTLLGVDDSAKVHRLAVGAATKLLDECRGARASVVTPSADEPDTFEVKTAAGADTGLPVGSILTAAVIPATLLNQLARGETLSAVGLSDLGLSGFDADPQRPLTLLPLLNGDRFFGVISVSAEEPLPAEVLKSLQAIRTQVSLALDSVALTAELTRQALHDPLTGLGNRAFLNERLTRVCGLGGPLAALLIDLNGFKQVNDVHGHQAGDRLLRAVADRLRSCVRADDVVARLGGDEFVVITPGRAGFETAVALADRIIAALELPVEEIGGQAIRTPASIGIVLSDNGPPDPDALLQSADAAMYAAKRAGGSRYHIAEVGAAEAHGSAAPMGDRSSHAA